MQLRVFISSTFTDLVGHRAALFSTLTDNNVKVLGMEFFGSRPGAPKEECLAEVRTAHIFVLVLGMRYGSIDAETGLSFTHLEYLEAQRASKPCLIYHIDEARHPVLPKDVDIGDSGVKLKTLKEAVARSHVVATFGSPEELKSQFAKDIASLLDREKLVIESRELEAIVSKLPRVSWLNEDRLEFLVRNLGNLVTSYSRRSVVKEVLEFLLIGDRQSAVFLTTKHTGLDLRTSIDLCVAIDDRLRSVVKRGLSILEKTEDAKSGAPDSKNSVV